MCAVALVVATTLPVEARAADPGGNVSGAERAASACRQFPKHARIVRLNLKPETDVVDLVAWIASVTCRQFVVPGTVTAGGRHVTVHAPQLLNAEEAYALFLTALDSVGLTVQPSGRFYRIIETSKAKASPLPLYGFDGKELFDEESVDGHLDIQPVSPPPRGTSRKRATENPTERKVSGSEDVS